MDGSDGGLLPFDILVEILLKLPGKPLMRFKCVSKSWFSLITDPAFAELHNSRSHNRGDGGKFLVTRTNTEACLVCIIDMKKERVSVWEPSIPYGTDRMTNIVNGLICFYHKSYDKRLIHLYNLTSRESISLPSTQAEDHPWRSSDQFSRVCLLGFDPINKEYKVLHFYSQWTYHLGRHNVKCQLHTIGDRKKVWRPLDISHICDFVVNLICENVFCVDGFLYWTRRQVMIVFDVGREIFKLIPFPKEQSSFCLQSGLVKVHCRLYLVEVSHSRGLPCGTFEIIWWRLKEGKDTSDSHWTKEDVTRVTHENILAERGRRSLKVKCFNHLGQIFSARSPNSKISIIDYFDLVTGYRHKFEAFNPRGFLRLGISRATEVVDNIMPLRNAFLVSE